MVMFQNIIKKLKSIVSNDYDSAPIERKRMIIAQDVIDSLKVKKFNATHCYADVYTGEYGFDEHISSTCSSNTDVENNKQLNDYLKDPVVYCNVCAIGGLLMAHIMRDNHITVQQFAVSSPSPAFIINRLHGLFSEDQLHMMEIAYELWDESKFLSEPFTSKSYEFGCLYDNCENRMIAIMQNVIDNKGTFKP